MLPALLVTVSATLLIAILLFTPEHLERAGGSLLHALSSLSNFSFWSEASYFDSDSRVKPFLHTWSLSIEEQFYLFWPVSLLLILKVNRAFAPMMSLLLVALVSLFLNHVFHDGKSNFVNGLNFTLPDGSAPIQDWVADGHSTIFYLLPFRLYEFAIGGMLVWLDKYQPKKNMIRELVLLGGLLLVGYSVLQLDESILFPYFYALIPCIGTAMIIYAGKARFIGAVLRNRLAVWIGLISYSLYLIH